MQIGFVGLGKMGGNMVVRLAQGAPDGSKPGGHAVVGYARDPNPALASLPGFQYADSVPGIVKLLTAAPDAPRVVWVMVPSGDATEQVLSDLAKEMSPGDVIIDGGNSYFKDTLRRAEGLKKNGIQFVDVGTSGGVWGLKEGYCMMVGGETSVIEYLTPLFETLAPKDGWAHMGKSGAGHFVKMVHNGIEYGMMQAYGEGFELLYKSQFDLDLPKIAQVWNHGSVVRSWLLELAERALKEQPTLAGVQPYVQDSGEGRWTIQAAIDEDVAVPVIAASLFARFASRDPYHLAARFSAALRNQFGGHEIKKAETKEISKTGEIETKHAT